MENEEEMKYLLFLLFIHLLGSVLFYSLLYKCINMEFGMLDINTL